MQPNELVGIYNHVRRMGGYRPEAMTDIAGMMISVVRFKTDGIRVFAIARQYDLEDDTQNWTLGFKMLDTGKKGPPVDDGLILWLRRPPKPTLDLYDARRNGDFIVGDPRVLHILGNYDAYQRDAALLRMFTSEWEHPTHAYL